MVYDYGCLDGDSGVKSMRIKDIFICEILYRLILSSIFKFLIKYYIHGTFTLLIYILLLKDIQYSYMIMQNLVLNSLGTCQKTSWNKSAYVTKTNCTDI